MKKFLALILGLTVFSTGAIMLEADAAVYRYFSNRLGHFKYYRPLRARFQPFQPVRATAKTPVSLATLKYEYQQTGVRRLMQDYRLQRPQLFPRYANLFQSEVNVTQRTDYLPSVQTVATDTSTGTSIFSETISSDSRSFGMQMPKQFQEVSDNVFVDPTLNLQMNILELDDSVCHAESFLSCAINYGKHYRDQNNLVVSWDMARKSFTQAGATGKYEAVVETFLADGFGNEYVYMTFSAQDPLSGKVVRMEASAPKQNADAAWLKVRPIFTSFRFQK